MDGEKPAEAAGDKKANESAKFRILDEEERNSQFRMDEIGA